MVDDGVGLLPHSLRNKTSASHRKIVRHKNGTPIRAINIGRTETGLSPAPTMHTTDSRAPERNSGAKCNDFADI